MKAADEVLSAGKVLKLHAEVVHDESEGNAVGGMTEEADSAGLMVAMCRKSFDKDILGDLAGVR